MPAVCLWSHHSQLVGSCLAHYTYFFICFATRLIILTGTKVFPVLCKHFPSQITPLSAPAPRRDSGAGDVNPNTAFPPTCFLPATKQP